MRFGKILHITFAVLLVLIMAGHLLLNNKKFQQKTAQRIVRIVKSTLDADVTAGSAQFVYPFGIAVDNLTVYDLNKDTLVHVASAVIRLRPIHLLWNKVNITSIRLLSPSVRLWRADAQAEPNYSFLISGSQGDGEGFGNLLLKANSILVRNGSLRYDVLDSPQTDSVFNSNHIALNSLNAQLSLKAMASDSLSFIIRKLSLSEHDGFSMSSAKGALTIGKEFAHVTKMQFNTPNSSFNITELFAKAGLTKRPNGIPELDAQFKANVTGSDFKWFFPQLSCLNDNIDLALDCKGDGNTLAISSLGINTKNGVFNMNGKGKILTGQDKIIKGCSGINVNASFNENLAEWLSGQLCGFNVTLPQQLYELGDGSFYMDLDSKDKKIFSNLNLACQAGTLTGSVNTVDGAYVATLQGKELMLNTITGNNDLGNADFTANATITESRNKYSGVFSSIINSITYKQYDYRDIALNGSFSPDTIVSGIGFSDRNGAIDMDALLYLGDNHSYNLNLSADNLNISAYNLTDRDSMIVSANLTARFNGNSLDELNGKMSLDSVAYSDSQGSWNMDNLTLSMNDVNETTRIVSLFGDFINISVVGDYLVSSLPYTLTRACGDVLPTVGKMLTSNFGENLKRRQNNFVIDAGIENTDFAKALLHFPMELKDPAKLRFSFNDADSIYTGQLSVPSLNIADESLSQVMLVVNSDKGTCHSELTGKYGESDLVEVKASLLAFQDIIRGKYSWSNTQGDVRGSAKTLSQFFAYDSKNGLKSMLLIDSTKVYVKNTEWKVSITDIRTDMGKITVNGMNISNIDQMFGVDGTISADSSDVLNVYLRNIDLDRTLTKFHVNSMMLQGNASGSISLAGLTGKPAFFGSFTIDGFGFMDSYHGDLVADCHWDQNNEKVVLNARMTDPGKADTHITGFYVPAQKNLDVTIDAGHTDLHFLNHWTDGVFKELSGRALGQLRLFGTLPDLDLEGQAVVENGVFVQEDVNTTFYIRNDTLWFEPGKMNFRNVEFFDNYGHDGILTCILNHDHFSDWSVDMTADVSNMLVYNQPKSEKSSFYATVYAEGNMNLLYNRFKGLSIEVNARTAPGTRLGIKPNSGTVADYNFLTIVDRNAVAAYDDAFNAILPETKKKSSNFSLSLNIDCSEDAMIDMSVSSLTGLFRGNGTISVKFDPKDGVLLNGIYNLSQGQCTLSIEDLVRKNFTLLEGSYVRFYGSPMDTELNLLTYHNVNSVSIYDLDPSASSNNNVRVRCLLGITGNVSEPRLSFDIDMPSGTSQEKEILASAISTEEQRNIQFMYLLAIGRFYTYDVKSEGKESLTPSAMESIVNSTVSGQINNLLSQVLDNDKVSISSNLSASSYLNNDATNLNNKELEGILEARLLNNRLLVNGSFGYRENTINNTSNFVGDIDARYLLYEAPRHDKKLSIKGYNKSNDKYFSKATLTTQGVGLVYEMDF